MRGELRADVAALIGGLGPAGAVGGGGGAAGGAVGGTDAAMRLFGMQDVGAGTMSWAVPLSMAEGGVSYHSADLHWCLL
jgi:hypothetical protein